MNSASELKLAVAANSTDTSFTGKIPVTTEPNATSNLGYHDLASENFSPRSSVPDWLLVIPFGTANNNETFNLRVWGWNKVAGSQKWIPVLLAEVACTLGNIAQGDASTFMVDTITKTYGGDDVDIISPVADVAGSFLIHLRGHQTIEFTFDNGTGTAMNAYWRPVDRK